MRCAEPAPASTETNEGLRVDANGAGISPVDVETAPFPAFPTDLQAQFMALMTRAKGVSRITETIFENRFMHVQELARFGAHIKLDGDTAIVDGRGSSRRRAGDGDRSARLGLARHRRRSPREGETTVNRVYHLDRGFERLEKKLARLRRADRAHHRGGVSARCHSRCAKRDRESSKKH